MDWIYVAILAILFFSAFTQGFAGFGYPMIAIPLLTLLIDIKTAIPLTAISGLAITGYLLIRLRKHLSFKELKNLIIGSIIGVPIGVKILSSADPRIIQILLGIIILLFVLLTIFNVIKTKKINDLWGYPVGLISGILGGAINVGGPPVIIFVYLQSDDKYKQKASITGFFFISAIAVVISHIYTGIATPEIIWDSMKIIPLILLGVFLGDKLFKYVSSEIYKKLVLTGLIIIGTFLILG